MSGRRRDKDPARSRGSGGGGPSRRRRRPPAPQTPGCRRGAGVSRPGEPRWSPGRRRAPRTIRAHATCDGRGGRGSRPAAAEPARARKFSSRGDAPRRPHPAPALPGPARSASSRPRCGPSLRRPGARGPAPPPTGSHAGGAGRSVRPLGLPRRGDACVRRPGPLALAPPRSAPGAPVASPPSAGGGSGAPRRLGAGGRRREPGCGAPGPTRAEERAAENSHCLSILSPAPGGTVFSCTRWSRCLERTVNLDFFGGRGGDWGMISSEGND